MKRSGPFTLAVIIGYQLGCSSRPPSLSIARLRGSGPDIRLPMDISSDVHNLRYPENLSG